jgi:RNA polymerase sigma factor (sigma-70 family)
LYERFSAQIFGYCLHQLGSREEAEDAVQTTFMNAFRGLSRGIVPEVESAWLFKIAHNVCLSRRRSSWRRGRVEAPNNFEVLQEIVPGRESASDELIRLQDVLEEMPENQRRAILLREWQGLTYREISAELGLSQAAVETLIFRARRSLAQGLESSTWKKRVRTTANAGGALASLKMLVGGGGAAAAKIMASALAIATAAVAATSVAPAPKKAHHTAAKPRTAAAAHKRLANHATLTAGAHITATGITSERTRPAGRRPERSKPEPATTSAAPATVVATAEAPPASPPQAALPPGPAASAPTPEAKPAAPAPAPTTAPAPEKGKSKGKKEKSAKPEHGTKVQPTPEPAEAAPAPTDAAWGEPDPDPPPTPSSQESKPDKGPKPDKPEKDHGHGNDKG